MARFFKRSTTRRTRYTISPSEAGKIFEQEFKDNNGNTFRLEVDVKPHLPSQPTFESNVQSQNNQSQKEDKNDTSK